MVLVEEGHGFLNFIKEGQLQKSLGNPELNTYFSLLCKLTVPRSYVENKYMQGKIK